MDLEALVRTLGGRDNRGVADERVVDTRVRNQVSLELVEINIKSTVETQRRGDRADNLSNQTVQMLIAGTRNVQVTSANIVDSLVIDQESTVGIFDSAVSRQNRVVGFYNSS